MHSSFMRQDAWRLPEILIQTLEKLSFCKSALSAFIPFVSFGFKESPLSRTLGRLGGRIASACLLAAIVPAVSQGAITMSTGVVTNPLNLTPPVQQAYQEFYILDYKGALIRFEKIQAQNPSDPIAVDYLLDCTLFQELYRLDLLDTTFYAHDGFLTGKHSAAVADPVVASRINLLIDQAVNLANTRLAANPNDVDALFARGWARSLDAIDTGLINRSFLSALRLALQARSDDERVLKLSPNYVDAKLVVGVHEYVVGSLPFAFKMMAGLAGITGSKTKGISDLEDAGAHGVLTSVEARTALGLFLRREAKYSEAIQVMRSLMSQYPRDFLFCLEVANLTKDNGNGPQAMSEYRALLRQAQKPGYFPSAHLELAWFGLAETLRGQRDYANAASAYVQAAKQAITSPDLRARCQLNAGEMYDILNQRNSAEQEYQAVLRDEPNSSPADSARKYLKSPFSAK
jgi:hypothetical protein